MTEPRKALAPDVDEAGPEDQSDQPGLAALARRYVLTLGTGWWNLGRRLLKSTGDIVARLSFVELAFLGACLGIIATTLLFPWIVYDVDLLAPEIAGRGSNYRLLFFLPGPLGMLAFAIGGRFRVPLFYAFAAVATALFLTGLIWSNPVHTLMQDPGDYRFHPALFIYGVALALSLGTAWRALQGSLVSPAAVREYLLEPRQADEDLNSVKAIKAGRF